MPENLPPVTMEGVRLIFKNFSGKATKFKPEGTRTFAVILDEKTAQDMAADGWNVKRLNPREEDIEDNPEGTPYLEVTVSYKNKPPRIVMMPSHNPKRRTNLDEESIAVLDFAYMVNVDLIVNPYHWDVSGRGGVKAYLQSMYVTIEEDALDRKYSQDEGQDPNA